MDKQIKETVELFVEGFIEKTTFNIAFEIKESREGGLLIELKTDEPQIWIGEDARTLWDMQTLFNRIFKKKLSEEARIDLDVNQYKQNKARFLKDAAHEAANRVALFKKEERLPSMTAYERRVVHMELATRADVITESVGENDSRRIIIKPAGV
ncbi:MAG: hypothetical protein PHU56_00355 [Candidatus Pacebacteria bacterium]|nr:hypothetical protein [Candidatus Paceibacterota bacterium]